MPMVGKKKFPYTAKGEKDAKMEAMKSGKPMKKAAMKKTAKKKTAKKVTKRGLFGGM
jgi:hypothetical protein